MKLTNLITVLAAAISPVIGLQATTTVGDSETPKYNEIGTNVELALL